MKIKYIFAFISALLLSACMAGGNLSSRVSDPQASESAKHIVHYLNFSADGIKDFRRAMSLRLLPGVFERDNWLGFYNAPALENRIAIMLDQKVSRDNIDEFVAFSRSPAGRSLGALIVQYESLSKVPDSEVQRLPLGQRTVISGLLEQEDSGFFKAVLAAASEYEIWSITSKYNKEVMCSVDKLSKEAGLRVYGVSKCE